MIANMPINMNAELNFFPDSCKQNHVCRIEGNFPFSSNLVDFESFFTICFVGCLIIFPIIHCMLPTHTHQSNKTDLNGRMKRTTNIFRRIGENEPRPKWQTQKSNQPLFAYRILLFSQLFQRTFSVENIALALIVLFFLLLLSLFSFSASGMSCHSPHTHNFSLIGSKEFKLANEEIRLNLTTLKQKKVTQLVNEHAKG